MNKTKEGFKAGDIVVRFRDGTFNMPVNFITEVIEVIGACDIKVLNSAGVRDTRDSFRFRFATEAEKNEYLHSSEILLSNILL